jgi:NADPH2:quinone reductase
MLVSFGNASGAPPAVEPLQLMRAGSVFLTRPTLGDYVATTEELDASAAALFGVIASGVVKVEIGQSWPLREVAEAHRALEARQTTGSTILLP